MYSIKTHIKIHILIEGINQMINKGVICESRYSTFVSINKVTKSHKCNFLSQHELILHLL